MNVQIFNPTAELAIPTRIQSNEVNAKIETQILRREMETRKFSN